VPHPTSSTLSFTPKWSFPPPCPPPAKRKVGGPLSSMWAYSRFFPNGLTAFQTHGRPHQRFPFLPGDLSLYTRSTARVNRRSPCETRKDPPFSNDNFCLPFFLSPLQTDPRRCYMPPCFFFQHVLILIAQNSQLREFPRSACLSPSLFFPRSFLFVCSPLSLVFICFSYLLVFYLSFSCDRKSNSALIPPPPFFHSTRFVL